MALVLRGARAAGVLKQVATAPLAQVRSLGRAVPGPVANVVFVEKPRPACLLIRPRFRSMSARATHPSTHSPDERRPTPRAASASPRRDARAWARPSPRTSPQPVRYVRRSSGDAPSKTSSLNRNPREAKKRHLGVFFFFGRRGKRFRRRRDDLRSRREKSEPLKTRTRTSADRVFSPFRLFFGRPLSTCLASLHSLWPRIT